uniref:UvrD-like helicase C-terminal domain-containing protein n=1 Tax=Octopus bimaculoides TaxID=37653 RepID=A0A0L8H3T3_OCTBM
MHQYSTATSLISGSLIDRRVLIPGINLAPSDPNLERTQFLVRLSHAMTIDKSQGQTFEKVGLVLPQPVFSHGPLYVAYSRARKLSDVRVKVMETDRQGRRRRQTVTKNIV